MEIFYREKILFDLYRDRQLYCRFQQKKKSIDVGEKRGGVLIKKDTENRVYYF